MRGFAREARRRPELDLLVGPLEAASIEGEDAPPDGSAMESPEHVDPSELPTWREGG